jgi:hypothetical protein
MPLHESWHDYNESLIERGRILMDIGFIKSWNKAITTIIITPTLMNKAITTISYVLLFSYDLHLLVWFAGWSLTTELLLLLLDSYAYTHVEEILCLRLYKLHF